MRSRPWEMFADPWIMLEGICEAQYHSDYARFETEQVTGIVDWRPLAGNSLVQLKCQIRCEIDKDIEKGRLAGNEFTFELLALKGFAKPWLVVEVVDEERSNFQASVVNPSQRLPAKWCVGLVLGRFGLMVLSILPPTIAVKGVTAWSLSQIFRSELLDTVSSSINRLILTRGSS